MWKEKYSVFFFFVRKYSSFYILEQQQNIFKLVYLYSKTLPS